MINQNYFLEPLLAQNVCCISNAAQHLRQLKTRSWSVFTSCVCDSNVTSDNQDLTLFSFSVYKWKNPPAVGMRGENGDRSWNKIKKAFHVEIPATPVWHCDMHIWTILMATIFCIFFFLSWLCNLFCSLNSRKVEHLTDSTVALFHVANIKLKPLDQSCF